MEHREKKREQTFAVTVTGTAHGEWQGVLRLPDGSEQTFGSLLELLAEMRRASGPELPAPE